MLTERKALGQSQVFINLILRILFKIYQYKFIYKMTEERSAIQLTVNIKRSLTVDIKISIIWGVKVIYYDDEISLSQSGFDRIGATVKNKVSKVILKFLLWRSLFLNFTKNGYEGLTPRLSAWPLRGHRVLKSILEDILHPTKPKMSPTWNLGLWL